MSINQERRAMKASSSDLTVASCFYRADSMERLAAAPGVRLTDEDLFAQLQPFDQWVHIGSGSFGSVFITSWLGCRVVVKCTRGDADTDDEDDAGLEAVMGSSLKHPNVVQFFCASPSAIVMEHMEGGSLGTRMFMHKTPPPLQTRRRWMHDVVSAVRYLHTCGVVHGDLNIDNVLLTASGVAKIGDFGGSYFCNSSTAGCGQVTDRYAPLGGELCLREAVPRGYERDVYAMACVLLNIVCWNSDTYNIFGLTFFERHYMAASDKHGYIRECIDVSYTTVWERLVECLPDDESSRALLFYFFARPSVGRASAASAQFFQDKTGGVVGREIQDLQQSLQPPVR
jgi:serine/threonine protein kinase